MEIIKRGSLPSERVYEAKCETHRNEEYVMVECPVCKHTVSVDGGAYIKQGNNT